MKQGLFLRGTTVAIACLALACAVTAAALGSPAATHVRASTAGQTATRTGAVASGPLRWSAAINPQRRDAAPDNPDTVSCPTKSFCAATATTSDVLVSHDPAAGAASWKIVTLPSSDGEWELDPIQCFSAKLCLALDGDNHIWSSRNPGNYRDWTRTKLAPTQKVDVVDFSCAGAHLCVAVGASGEIWSSAQPTGPVSAWHLTKVHGDWSNSAALDAVQCKRGSGSAAVCWATIINDLTNKTIGYYESSAPLSGGWHNVGAPPAATPNPAISCPTSSFCVKVGKHAAVSTATSSSGPWTAGQINGWSELTGVDCQAHHRCVAADMAGNVLATTSGLRWTAGQLTGTKRAGGVSCPTARYCLTGVVGGVMLSRTPFGAAHSWKKIAFTAIHKTFVSALSCPSAKLCIATTYSGVVLASTDPSGPGSSWKVVKRLPVVDTRSGWVGQALAFANCRNAHLCFAGTPWSLYAGGNTKGELMMSTDPAKAGSWHEARLGFDGISCPTAHLCIASRQSSSNGGPGGDTIAYSTKPAASAHAWVIERFSRLSVGAIAVPASSISCLNAHLCVAAGADLAHGGAGAVAVSTDPTRASSWKIEDLTGAAMLGVSCGAGRCVAWDTNGDLFDATEGKPS